MIISSCLCQKESFFKPVIGYKQEKIFKKYEGAIVGRCQNCGLLKTVVKPKFFSSNSSNINFYEQNKEKFINLFQPIIKKLRKIKTKGKVLDVGCSIGILTRLLIENRFDAFGVEPNYSAYKKAKKLLKNKIFLGTVKDFLKNPKNKNKKFDVIIYNHVLEHIEDINQEFFYVHQLLKKRGILIIGAPNTTNVIFWLRKKYWESLRIEEHIWHFSKNYLVNYLKNQKFKIIAEEFRNDQRENYPIIKKIYFYLLILINKLLKTGEAVTIYAQKI